MTNEIKMYRITMGIFVASGMIHLLGYFTNVTYFLGWFMWLPAIVLSVFAVKRIMKDGYIVNSYIEKKKIFLSSEFICMIITIIYVIINVIYCCYILRNGGGEKNGDIYYLINLGERIREISVEEYSHLVLAEYRMFTGHILFLYALLLLFYKTRRMESDAV